MRADELYEGGVFVSPQKYLQRNKSGRIPRPQMPLRKIKRNSPILHAKIFSDFFGIELIPLWFINAFEIKDQNGPFHTEYYRKNVEKPFAWCPIYFGDKNPDYTVFYTTVNMIDYCERLIDTFTNMPITIESTIREIQDRYVLISLHMEQKNCYTNTQLFEQGEKGCSPFDLYRPRKDIAFTIESLPDLFIHVYHCNFWGEDTEDPFDSPVDKKLMSFLKKLIPEPCKSRSLTDITSELWLDRSKKKSKKKLSEKDANIMFDINIRLTLAGLLGIYDHCKKKANLGTRRKIYCWFYLRYPDKDTFSSWYNENSYLILYIMREFLLFSISHISAMQRYMVTYYYWTFITNNAYESMDYVRNYSNEYIGNGCNMHPLIDETGKSVMNQYCLEKYFHTIKQDSDLDYMHWHKNQDWFSAVHEYLFTANKTCLNYANRAMEKNFIDKVVEITLKEDSEDGNIDPRWIAIHEPPQNKYGDVFDKAKEEELEDFIMNSDAFSEVKHEYGWIVRVYRVDWKSVSNIKHAERLMVQETSRSNLREVLKDIKMERPYDYAVIRCLFISFKKKFSIVFHKLPSFILEKQVETMKTVSETPKGERLYAQAGLYYVCRSCGDVKTHVHDSRTQKRKDLSVEKEGENWVEEKMKQDNKDENIRELSMYFRGIAMDTTDGGLYCYVKKNKDFQNPIPKNKEDAITTKKKGGGGDMTVELIGKHKIRKANKKKKSQKKKKGQAPNVETTNVDNGDNDKVTNSNRLKKYYMSSRCGNRVLEPFNAFGQTITTEDNGPCFMCPHCLSFTTFGRRSFRDSNGNVSCGCMKTDFRWKFRCELCQKGVHSKVYIRWILDDIIQKNEVRPIVICRKHKLQQIKRWKGIIRLSELRPAIYQQWRVIVLPDGTQFFDKTLNQ